MTVDKNNPKLPGKRQASNTMRRVLAIAGLDDGREAVQLLLDHPRVDLVGLFVLDEDTGRNIAGFRTFDDLVGPPVLRKIKYIREYAEEIKQMRPDIIFIIGFSQIIPKLVIDTPLLGVIGFHTAILPGRRGCSPVIWAIADGLSETGVTMFYMNEGIDTGDIIATKKFPINPDDQALDVLRKADSATISLLGDHLDKLLDGTAPRTKFDKSMCTYTRKRTAADGEIDWSKPAKDICNLIRALSPPYPMAHTFGGDGVPILIEKARPAPDLVVPLPRHATSYPLPQTVLCIAAHPDDELLGIGGTLILHSRAGADVIVLIMSEGEEKKLNETPNCSTRRECALKAAKLIGVKKTIFHDFPDQQLDRLPIIDIIKVVEAVIKEFRPQIVYTHHRGDANTDHQVVFKAVYAACRPMSSIGSVVRRLLTFETPSSTDQAPQIGEYVFSPNCYIDIESAWEKKTEALNCYPTEMIGGNHPRSLDYIEALARMRGGHAGCGKAEGFYLIRERITFVNSTS
jgi:methionyl-tRNA formyltransferase/LmbE family N-acetylglucosaminyl deacetylase